MARKAKKKVHPMPKLGWKDMLLYWTLLIVTFLGAFVAFMLPDLHRAHLIDANPQALSYSASDGYLNCFWLAAWLFVVWLVILAGFYNKRTPVFGRKDIQYGPPAYPRVFPLLMKNKPQYWESERAKSRKKKLRCLAIGSLIATFLFSAALYPRSLYSRYELRTDGTIVVFDHHNKETEHHYLQEIDSVSIRPYRHSHKGHSYWEVYLETSFSNGDSCRFSVFSMADDPADSLRQLQRLKEIYKSVFSIEEQDKLWMVVLDRHLTNEQSKLLYDVFETQQP